MKQRYLILTTLFVLLSALFADGVMAQRRKAGNSRGYWHQTRTIDEYGDTIPHIYSLPVYVYNRGIDMRRWAKLVNAVKKVYPIAQIAKDKMADMEAELTRLPTKKAQKEYIKKIYNEIEAEYTPILKKMTRTQGRVLLKLIDRETSYTAYEILKEFRGGFVAGFWQTVGKVFGQDLKDDYDKTGEDKMIEQIVIYYEAGLI